MYFAFFVVKWLIIHTEYKTKHVEIIWSLKTHDLNTAKIQGGLGKLWGLVLELRWVILVLLGEAEQQWPEVEGLTCGACDFSALCGEEEQ